MCGAWEYYYDGTDEKNKVRVNWKNPAMTILGTYLGNEIIGDTICPGAGCVLISKELIKSPIFPKEYFLYLFHIPPFYHDLKNQKTEITSCLRPTASGFRVALSPA